jgi:hypothetical protein
MEIDAEFIFRSEFLHRLLFPDRRVVLDVATDLRREDEKAAIDPAAAADRFLLETRHPVALIVDRSEAAGRLGRRHRSEAALSAMQIDRSADIYIGWRDLVLGFRRSLVRRLKYENAITAAMARRGLGRRFGSVERDQLLRACARRWFSSIGRLKIRLHDRLARPDRGDGPIRPCVVLSAGQ